MAEIVLKNICGAYGPEDLKIQWETPPKLVENNGVNILLLANQTDTVRVNNEEDCSCDRCGQLCT